MTQYILSIDQGTTSSRAMIFDQVGEVVSRHQIEFKQYFPQDGWVEHDPEEIWQATLQCCQKALAHAKLQGKDIAALGISNQRESTLLWDKQSGEPVYPSIVWQDRRTADFCEQLTQKKSTSEKITRKTGLVIDPYFSASKINWLLNNVSGVREKALNNKLAFGTIDSFLLWRLTGGKVHATDATNASRTMLFNIHEQQWDEALLSLFNIPKQILPKVMDSAAAFGVVDKPLLGHEIPITGIAGDQQAAAVGQACIKPGMIKSTYGTGCFVLLNTGNQAIRSKSRLLTTVAYRINGQVTYALEGSNFNAGTAIKWLRDSLGVIQKAQDTEAMASGIADNGGVYFVPAFTGLGAPHWDPKARGAIMGLTRDSQVEHVVRAALEAVCYQTRDLLEAMMVDYREEIQTLRVDGGMVANNWLMQFLADIIGSTVERIQTIETSAKGAAFLAGLGAGIYQSLADIENYWKLDRDFKPTMPETRREKFYSGWKKAVACVRSKA